MIFKKFIYKHKRAIKIKDNLNALVIDCPSTLENCSRKLNESAVFSHFKTIKQRSYFYNMSLYQAKIGIKHKTKLYKC